MLRDVPTMPTHAPKIKYKVNVLFMDLYKIGKDSPLIVLGMILV